MTEQSVSSAGIRLWTVTQGSGVASLLCNGNTSGMLSKATVVVRG